MEIRLLQNRAIRWYIIFIICIGNILGACTEKNILVDEYIEATPKIFPDYTDVMLPANISPINFKINEIGDEYVVSFGTGGRVIFRLDSYDGIIRIPEDKWKNYLQNVTDNEFFIRIFIRRGNKWFAYNDIKNFVSKDSIDSYLVYRLLYPGYELWNEMGIYQRNLSSFDEIPVLKNTSFDKQCINCHTFNKNSSEVMMFHIRGKKGGTIIRKNNAIKKVDMKPKNSSIGGAYSSLHPNGNFIAFSMNEIQQFFHRSGKKPIEVVDLESDLGVYDIEDDEMISHNSICDSMYMETFPCWSADGKEIFFCRAKSYMLGQPLDSIYYDLCKIPFNSETKTFGSVEEIFKASEINKSVSFPRISPDGNFLLFTLSNYGNFSIWHPESDLYLLDLRSGNINELSNINSNDVESYHSWSSSGKWIVFSSKRINGQWAHPYFSHFNHDTGEFSKPFLLPQKDPLFYDNFSMTFNIPELITEPILNDKSLIEAINSDKINHIILRK